MLIADRYDQSGATLLTIDNPEGTSGKVGNAAVSISCVICTNCA